MLSPIITLRASRISYYSCKSNIHTTAGTGKEILASHSAMPPLFSLHQPRNSNRPNTVADQDIHTTPRDNDSNLRLEK